MLSEKLSADFGIISRKIVELVKANYLLLLLVLLNFVLFLLNYSYGKYYALADIPLFELNPGNELWRRLFIWQEQRGFGLEFGQDIGLTGLLSGLTLLSSIGLSPVSVTYIYNMCLFILPAIAIFFLSFAFFYDNKHRNKIAFFAGLFGNLNFYIYITGNHPLFLRKFPGIMIAFLLGAVILVLKTRKKRYWGLFGLFSFLNLASFDAPAFFILGAFLIFLYIVFYLIFESENFRHDLPVIAGLAAIFFSISAPGIVANIHLMFYTDFLKSPLLSQYTSSLFLLNQAGFDNSGMVNSLRLMGTVNWDSSIPLWKGSLNYPFYTIFTTNPLFVLLSFFLPVLAFGSLAFKSIIKTKRKLIFLSLTSIIFLFLIKGTNQPLGELFMWGMQNIPYFMIFRQPYDKAGIVLMITMSLAAGYGLTRLCHFNFKHSKKVLKIRIGHFNIKLSKKELKMGVFLLIIASLIVNAYPALSGDVFDKTAFFELPQSYYDLPEVVTADPALYKIAILPELAYSNQLHWGYYGIGLHSWSLNKPVLVKSFTGSDIFSESMTMAILHEVSFLSNAHFPHNIYDETAPILSNNNISEETINSERVEYFTYILKKSNVGKIIYRNDLKGIGSVDIQDVDLEKYQLLFDTMKNQLELKEDKNFGELTLYSLQNWAPLIYTSSEKDSYYIPDYDVFLDSYYTNARYAVLASFFDYNISKEFIQAKENSDFSNSIYTPLYIPEYFQKVNGELNIAKTQLNQDTNKLVSLEERKSALLQYMEAPFHYYDYIDSPGEFDVFIKIPTPPPNPDSQIIDLVDQIITTMSTEFDNGNLVLDSYVDQIETALQPSNVSELSEKLGVPFVSNLRIAVSNRDYNAIRDRIKDLRIQLGDLIGETLETINGTKFVYNTNGKEKFFNLTLTQTNDNWYRAGTINLEKGTFLGQKDFLSNFEIVLTRNTENSLEKYPPKVSFYQINPVKYKILIENISQSFFLNFLESYSLEWKLYPSNHSDFNRDEVNVNSFAYQLDNKPAWFDFSDITCLSSNMLFEKSHHVLNGFANSWYINFTTMTQSDLAIENIDGTYTIELELYYEPQSYLSLSIIIGFLMTIVLYVIIFWKRIRVNFIQKFNQTHFWITRRIFKIEE